MSHNPSRRKTENAKPSKVLVIGSGPIVIGQSAEFDYSGAQACRSLREEGVKVVLVNSNPATIQTDYDIADIVYIEPLTPEFLEKIIERERPDAILPTMGGQTGLNLAVELGRKGILQRNGVAVIGTSLESIENAESREKFNEVMKRIGIPILPGIAAKDYLEAYSFAESIGYPVILRPAFTLGGTGGGVAHDKDELKKFLDAGFRLSATHEVLVEKSVAGWGEFEYEVLRDAYDNAIIICNMENFDPMGVHTGESIVVAPSQTLSDRDHQMLRNAALKIVRAIGIVGGCNVQFSLNQQTGDFAVIEINPRLSRSSALASKATGYPIARVAAKIALGSSLPELKNAITGTTAAFEPALDYCVLKIPKWPFEKFVNAERTIGTQMKSTGEAMAIGRTFEEALMKAIRSLEVKLPKDIDLSKHLMPPTDLRLFAIFEWFRKGKSIDELNSITKINPWFLERIKYIVDMEERLRIAESKPLSHSQGARKPLSLNIGGSAPAGFVFSSPTGFPPKAATSEAQGFSPGSVSRELLLESKQSGFSDLQISKLIGSSEPEIRVRRKSLGILPTYKIVDSCAGEFEAITPYYYSTYEDENEARQMDGRKIVVIGSGPIRIGQGIEFDYCCSHAAFALKEMGFRSIMVNNNPETVSTDFDTSDRLYFEPLTFEDVLNIVENEGAEGVILQFGGQTSINLAEKLHNAGIRIFGTQLEGIDVAEDREKFRQLANELGISQPANGTATSAEGALSVAARIGYPVVVRPSYVIAGRGMRIVYTEDGMRSFIDEAVDVSENKPVLIDKYLENAFECEVDAVCDGKNVFIGGIMEHIEFAGVHSGDANIVLPSQNLDAKTISALEDYTRKLALALGTIGLINIQFAVKDEIIYILEANPRASRTVPFLSKAIGIPLAKLATRVLLGEKLNPEALEKQKEKRVRITYSVKGVVFPFLKIKGADIALGPEMKSTGETMGISESFDEAYVKALLSSGLSLPEKRESSAVLLSLRKEDKQYAPMLGRLLKNAGFMIFATPGTAAYLQDAVVVDKISANPDSKNEFNTNSGTTVLDVIDGGKISLVINTPQRGGAFNTDGFKIRRASIEKGIPCITNVRTAIALLQAVEKIKENEIEVKRLDEYGQRADSAGAEDAG